MQLPTSRYRSLTVGPQRYLRSRSILNSPTVVVRRRLQVYVDSGLLLRWYTIRRGTLVYDSMEPLVVEVRGIPQRLERSSRVDRVFMAPHPV